MKNRRKKKHLQDAIDIQNNGFVIADLDHPF